MLDIRKIREESEGLRAALARRGAAPDITPILEIDERRRALVTEIQTVKSKQKELSRRIGNLKREGQDAEALMTEVRGMGDEASSLEHRIREEEEAGRALMLDIPNPPHPSVPDGTDEGANVEVRRWGAPATFPFEAQDHLTIGERLGIIDLPRAAKIAGARFPLMVGTGAALERALLNFMMDLHTRRHGYTEVLPPFLINADSLVGTGQLPKFEEDLFKIDEVGLYLAPTAEVPVTNIYRDEILPERALPIKYAAFTPCFRREAGSYGKETRGLIRQHQFDKVELVRFSSPETSDEALEELTREVEEVLQRLEIHYRVIALCAGDLGFSAAKTYDVEAWLPSRGGYLEVSSCSNFEDFQARRAGIRTRVAGGGVTFVHTLNGSGLAIGRTIVALLENFQQKDGTVIVPPVLRPYLGGIETIGRMKAPWAAKGGDQPERKEAAEKKSDPETVAAGPKTAASDESKSKDRKADSGGGRGGRDRRRNRGSRNRSRQGGRGAPPQGAGGSAPGGGDAPAGDRPQGESRPDTAGSAGPDAPQPSGGGGKVDNPEFDR